MLFQLEITKTSDNKATFLHVLAETVFDRFPEVLTVGEELATISDAAKGIQKSISSFTIACVNIFYHKGSMYL